MANLTPSPHTIKKYFTSILFRVKLIEGQFIPITCVKMIFLPCNFNSEREVKWHLLNGRVVSYWLKTFPCWSCTNFVTRLKTVLRLFDRSVWFGSVQLINGLTKLGIVDWGNMDFAFANGRGIWSSQPGHHASKNRCQHLLVFRCYAVCEWSVNTFSGSINHALATVRVPMHLLKLNGVIIMLVIPGLKLVSLQGLRVDHVMHEQTGICQKHLVMS